MVISILKISIFLNLTWINKMMIQLEALFNSLPVAWTEMISAK